MALYPRDQTGFNVSNFTNENIASGAVRPSLVVAEDSQSSLILIDSRNSSQFLTNPFNFFSTLSQQSFRARQVKLSKITLPKPNNITVNNNTVLLEHSVDGSVSFDLNVGLYDPTSFINEFVTKANLALSTVTLSGVYDPDTRQITFTWSSGTGMFDSRSTFIIRGYSFSPFNAYTAGTVGANGTATMVSGISAFLYSRYIVINSTALTSYQLLGSSSNNPEHQNNSMIALIDISQMYDASDFDVSTVFTTNLKSILTPEAALINVCNSQKNMNATVDIQVSDEWGSSLYDSYDMNDGSPMRLGISLYLNLYF